MEPKFCDWVEEIFIQNEALVGGKINQLAQNDPYWHQVNLFYLQMEGLKNGLKLRADKDPRYGSTGCEVSIKRNSNVIIQNQFTFSNLVPDDPSLVKP